MAPSAISPTSEATHGENLEIPTPMKGHTMDANEEIPSSLAPQSSPDEELDLICVGFGPASLAIAIALHDAQTASPLTPRPKVLFLEKQTQFAWHAGMQLPGAKMQISFLKDLATPRDPTSRFTFTNYLHQNGRLNHFINLGTFLPSRAEYEDYLRWCASHFSDAVQYNQEVSSVTSATNGPDGKVTSFSVTSRDVTGGHYITRKARNVVIAAGGKPILPEVLQGLKHIAHSSQYASTIAQISERECTRNPSFAVIGSGQSAAEIFNNLWSRFPNSQIRLVIRGASLRQSDDSPFVNEIFDPDRVDGIYAQSPSERAAALALDRGTNYGVVRLTLLEHLYDEMYQQRLREPDSSKWRCQILPQRNVTSATQGDNGEVVMHLSSKSGEEVLKADYVFAATGYQRNAHEEMLSSLSGLLPEKAEAGARLPVSREYKVLYDTEKIDKSAGIWLQGCNEATHGLSDTLLSILAIRSGELVQSIFGQQS
ncbi:hypothetical protein BP6252_08447 [Coleophoma cylindrospora]|uniref:L-ornithine N(5)-monooxygenase [NAD(P)H] n=1 Tax=Coleophoma cylindrospora TaxID=1849047 RepID=A0A3D8R5Z8_9HELO|nr:hypothetical protein BP6252_08447 [Coleophoma cylindrospora]